MTRALLLGLLAVAGCQPGGHSRSSMDGDRPADPRAPDLRIETEIDYSTLPMEGEIGTFEVWIRNTSQRYVILRDLVQQGVGSVMSWQVSQPGTLTFNMQSAAYDHAPSRGADAETPQRAFNLALLAPGEEIHIKPRIRLLRLPRRFAINYFSLDRRQLGESVYFETRDAAGRHYRRLSGEALDKAILSQHVPPPVEPGAGKVRGRVSSHRTVVYPHAQTLIEAPRQAPLVLDVRLDPRPFTIEAAAERAGIDPKGIAPDYTYYASVEGWVLRTADGLKLVTQRSTQPLPDVSDPDLFFFLCDTMGSGSLAFAVRTPLEMRLAPQAFRLVPSRECPKCRARLKTHRCNGCGVATVPSDDVPRSDRPRECYTCKTRTADLKCATCGQATLGVDDGYLYVLHVPRNDVARLLRTLADEKFRIELSSDGQRIALVIRR